MNPSYMDRFKRCVTILREFEDGEAEEVLAFILELVAEIATLEGKALPTTPAWPIQPADIHDAAGRYPFGPQIVC